MWTACQSTCHSGPLISRFLRCLFISPHKWPPVKNQAFSDYVINHCHSTCVCECFQVRRGNKRNLENTLIPSLDSVFWIYPDWWSLNYLQPGCNLTAWHHRNGNLAELKIQRCLSVIQSIIYWDTIFIAHAFTIRAQDFGGLNFKLPISLHRIELSNFSGFWGQWFFFDLRLEM
jgi:hypothetical protein